MSTTVRGVNRASPCPTASWRAAGSQAMKTLPAEPACSGITMPTTNSRITGCRDSASATTVRNAPSRT